MSKQYLKARAKAADKRKKTKECVAKLSEDEEAFVQAMVQQVKEEGVIDLTKLTPPQPPSDAEELELTSASDNEVIIVASSEDETKSELKVPAVKPFSTLQRQKLAALIEVRCLDHSPTKTTVIPFIDCFVFFFFIPEHHQNDNARTGNRKT